MLVRVKRGGMNQVHEARMAGTSFYDARHSVETVDAAFLPDNSGRPAQRWKIYITGCLGNAERILR
jgi:hypothetical protein